MFCMEAMGRGTRSVRRVYHVSRPWREVISSIPGGVLCKLNGEPEEIMNGLFHEITGYSETEIKTIKCWEDILWSRQSSEEREIFESQLEKHGEYQKTLKIYTRKNSRPKFIDIHVKRSSGYEMWLLVDVTKHVASDERFPVLFNESTDAYLLVHEGVIMECNDTTVSILGRQSREEILYRHPSAFSPEYQHDGKRSDEKCVEVDGVALTTGFNRFEWVHTKSDGTELPVEVTLKKVEWENQVFLLIVWHDLTEHKKQQAELKKAKELAESFSHAKSQFLANMSHEIRTPMNGVIGMSKVLFDDKSLNPNMRADIELITSCSKNLLRILDDILELSSIEADSIVINCEPFEVRSDINDALALIREAAEKKRLSIKQVVSDDIAAFVVGDNCRLRRVVCILIDNAIKFTESGTITLSVIRPTKEELQELNLDKPPEAKCVIPPNPFTVLFQVSDTGMGIEKEVFDRLFDPFMQGDCGPRRKFGGIGASLTICKALVELMGGHITVQSEVDRGATFSFTVQLGNVDLSWYPLNGLPQPSRDWKLFLKCGSTLLVEDNKINRLVALRTLAFIQIDHVDVAVNGIEAIDACMKKDYDLILMDCHMPVMDGYTATRQIRQAEAAEGKGKHRFIVALTACAMKSDPRLCYDAGMDKYISKPFDLHKLQKIIEEHLHACTEKYARDTAARHREQVAEIQHEDMTVCQKVFNLKLAAVPEGGIAGSRSNSPGSSLLSVSVLNESLDRGIDGEVVMAESRGLSSCATGEEQSCESLFDDGHQSLCPNVKWTGMKNERHYDFRAINCKVAKFNYNEKSPTPLRKCHSACL